MIKEELVCCVRADEFLHSKRLCPVDIQNRGQGMGQVSETTRQSMWVSFYTVQGLKTGRCGRVRRSDLDAWLAGEGHGDRQGDGAGSELLRLQDAASKADVTRQTIWRWSNDGLKVVRRGRVVRIRADVLDDYLEGED